MKELTKGFVVVASRNPNFYIYACNLMDSIRDYYPDANITFFTEERFVDHRAEELADDVVFCGGHYREKLTGMSQTPYDITMYVDADMECEHEDIIKVWDEMKDYDMVFHELTEDRGKFYAIRQFDWENGIEKYSLCGGVCLYRSCNPLVQEFMEDWDKLYRRQRDGSWRPEGFTNTKQYDEDLKHFDQTTLWWLTNKEPKYKDLKIGFFEDDIRWNYFSQYDYSGCDKGEKPPILRHYSGCLEKDKYIV